MEKEEVGIGGLTLPAVMGRLPDPRSGHGRRHPLGAILGLAICAMLCGSRSLYAISQWGRDQGLEVSRASGFTRERTPRVSTLHQVFSRLDREALPTGFCLAFSWWSPAGFPSGLCAPCTLRGRGW